MLDRSSTDLAQGRSKHGAGEFTFRKMHGIGNDFVVVDLRDGETAAPSPAMIRALSDRHLGIGFDQFVAISPGSDGADAALDFWNADASVAGACGNGTRCAADLLLAGSGLGTIRARTVSGTLLCERRDDGQIRVDMGPPALHWADIPLASEMDTRDFPAPGGARQLVARASAVSMGNPHCVLFVADALAVDHATIGTAIQSDSLFPQGVNVSFAQVVSPTDIRLRVWERGAGGTLACGSAACATLVAAVRRGLANRKATIEFEKGSLEIDWIDDESGVGMTGPVTHVATGRIDPAFLAEHAHDS